MCLFLPVYRDRATREIKRSLIWWYDFQFDGVRYRGSTHTESRVTAEAVTQRKRDEVFAKWSGIKPWELVCGVCGTDIKANRCSGHCVEVSRLIDQIEEVHKQKKHARAGKRTLAGIRRFLRATQPISGAQDPRFSVLSLDGACAHALPE